MAEVENDDVDTEVTTDVETEDTSNDSNDSDDEITYERAIEWREAAAKYKEEADRREKAEKKIVELKKDQKTNTNTSTTSKEDVRKILAEERFYDKNPDATPYRSKIEEFQEKGLSLDDAYLLASRADKEVDESREVYGKGLIRGNQAPTEGIKMVSVDDFDRMSESEQNKYNEAHTKKYGAIKFK